MKPNIPEALPFVMSIYARHSAGCCWHVVLDDGNTESDTVRFCANSHDPKHADCAALAKLLPLMSRTQIRKLAALGTRVAK